MHSNFAVEAVHAQCRATKQIAGMKTLSYEQRLRKLKLPTLAFRRLRGDAIEVFKILNKHYDIEARHFFELSESHTRGHSLKINRPAVTRRTRLHSFSYRVIKTWNELPESVVSSTTVNMFKNRLDKHWDNHPLKYEVHPTA